MLRTLTLSAVTAFALSGSAALAAGAEAHVHDFDFSFEGPFGSYDQMQLQRGLQVYTEVCSSCHGLKFVPIRSIGDPGGPELPADQVRAYAEKFEVWDPELADGDGDFRPALPTDHYPASQLSNAPDLSLMAKARAGFHGPYGLGINQFFKGIGGPEYIATLLTSYEEPPACAPEDFEGAYNTAFAAGGIPDSCRDEHGHSTVEGSWIAMAQPLYGDDVEFEDGSSTEMEAIAEDVAAFLMWTAEPKMMARKESGFAAVLFLSVLTILLYLTNKRIWAPIKHRSKATPAE